MTSLKMHIVFVIFVCVSVLYSEAPLAKEVRTANVVVKNKTGFDLMYVGVIHQYSNDPKSKLIWKDNILENGAQTSSQKVTYTTGALTTGTSWWYVAWAPRHEYVINYTTPSNFRQQIDFIENDVAPFAWKHAPQALTLACSAVSGGTCSAVTTSLLTVTFNALENHLSMTHPGNTSGFKKHTLREADRNKTVVITLLPVEDHPNNVKIESPSGISVTKYSGSSPKVLSGAMEGMKALVMENFAARDIVNGKGDNQLYKESVCFTMVQDKVPYNKEGATTWNSNTIRDFCSHVISPSKLISTFEDSIKDGETFEQSVLNAKARQLKYLNGTDRGVAERYSLKIDCDVSGIDKEATKNTITATFLNKTGDEIISKAATEIRDGLVGCGGIQGVNIHVRTTKGPVSKVRVSTNGEDGFMIDKIKLYKDGKLVRSHGVSNDKGWCLSTDPSDGSRSWKGHAVNNKCTKSKTFDY